MYLIVIYYKCSHLGNEHSDTAQNSETLPTPEHRVHLSKIIRIKQVNKSRRNGHLYYVLKNNLSNCSEKLLGEPQ